MLKYNLPTNMKNITSQSPAYIPSLFSFLQAHIFSVHLLYPQHRVWFQHIPSKAPWDNVRKEDTSILTDSQGQTHPEPSAMTKDLVPVVTSDCSRAKQGPSCAQLQIMTSKISGSNISYTMRLPSNWVPHCSTL
jgi:hypothetical protein